LAAIGFQMSWRLLPQDRLELRLVGPDSNRWVSVGFGPSSRSMAGADYLVVERSVDGSTCSIGDFYGQAHAEPPVRDEGMASFNSADCGMSNGRMNVVVVRRLRASDGTDASINTKEQHFIYAAGSAAWPSYHGSQRGGGILNLESGGTAMPVADDADRVRRVWLLHGVTMIALFGFGYPVAIVCVLFFRHSRVGFQVHKLIGQTGIGAIVVTVLSMSFTTSATERTMHGYMGILTVTAALVLATIGNVIRAAPAKLRTYMAVVHKSLGYSVMLTTPITMWAGFSLLRPVESEALSGSPALWYLPVLCVALMAVCERLIRKYHLKEIPWETFQNMVKSGRALMVVHGSIIDIGAWGPLHPGGSMVLEPYRGRDATDIFDGEAVYTDVTGFQRHYAHPVAAKEKLSSLRIGTLVRSQGKARDTMHSVGFREYEMRLVSKEALTQSGEVLKFELVTNSPLFYGHSCRFIRPETGLAREYSPIGAAIKADSLHLYFIIKIYAQGEMTQWLAGLFPGDLVMVKETVCPVLRSPVQHGCWQRLLMLCAGTGITPMLRLIEYHTANRDNEDLRDMRLVLVWWLPRLSDAFLKETELQDMVQKLSGRLRVRICFTRETQDSLQGSEYSKSSLVEVATGRQVDESIVWVKSEIGHLSTGDENGHVRGLICGPAAFVQSMPGVVRKRMLAVCDRLLVL